MVTNLWVTRAEWERHRNRVVRNSGSGSEIIAGLYRGWASERRREHYADSAWLCFNDVFIIYISTLGFREPGITAEETKSIHVPPVRI